MTLCVDGYQCTCQPDEGVACPYMATGYGKGWRRKEWYSICSAHLEFDADCMTCHSGTWVTVWRLKVGQFFYWLSPSLWRWWANR